MAKHAPYYTPTSAANRGARFGATIGVIGAVIGIAMGAAAGFPLGAIGFSIAGAVAGMAVGAPLFAVSNLVTRSVPGLSHALGEDKPPQHLADRHHAMRNGKYTNVTSPEDYKAMQGKMQSQESNSDRVEQRRIEQMRLAGIE